METNKKNKRDFDAVEMMREIRMKINTETKGMSYMELRKYIDSKLQKRKRLIGEKETLVD